MLFLGNTDNVNFVWFANDPTDGYTKIFARFFEQSLSCQW
ncbi:hypothetical protein [Polaromonas sp. CG9_12]|nr:hypothetical protein [Polaromonas sp. CG9_12]